MRVDFPHKVKITCTDVSKWDQVIVSTLDLFGPDTSRWLSESTFNDMTFSFADERDALLFRLKFSERVIADANNTEQQAYI